MIKVAHYFQNILNDANQKIISNYLLVLLKPSWRDSELSKSLVC
jgi:hypothetical protein